jgi:hypothetical protein
LADEPNGMFLAHLIIHIHREHEVEVAGYQRPW